MSYSRTSNGVALWPGTLPARQAGIGNGWMLLTIGVMVGFILGFVLFLSRLPEEHYTLVETERAVEQYQTTEASQFDFYDRLSDSGSSVADVKADELPVFDRPSGTYGAAENERPGAVQIAEELALGDEFSVSGDIQPVEVAAVASSTVGGVASNALSTQAKAQLTVSKQQQAQLREIREPTVVKKIRNTPSTSYYLQAGAFEKGGDAKRLQQRLRSSGMDAFVRSVAIEGRQWHRVRIGPFYDSDTLYKAQTRLGRNGISYLVIKVQS